MPSPKRSLETDRINLIFFSISQEVLLQVSTLPVLLALVGGKGLFESLQGIGQASEEVFRGDRLPVLKFPVETKSK